MSYDNLTFVFNKDLERASMDLKRRALFSLIHIAELFNMIEEGSDSDANLTKAVTPFFGESYEVTDLFEWTLEAREISMREYYLLRAKGFIGKTAEGVYVL